MPFSSRATLYTVPHKFPYRAIPVSRVSGPARTIFTRFPFARFKVFTIYMFSVCGTRQLLLYITDNADNNEHIIARIILKMHNLVDTLSLSFSMLVIVAR